MEKLAHSLAVKPAVPLMMTKDHVNSIMRVMGAGMTSYADSDLARWVATEDGAKAALREDARAMIGKARRRD